MATYDQKVYKVTTGVPYKSEEDPGCTNWASYNVIAHTAEEAIDKAKKMLNKKFLEYVEEVELICTLD